MKNNLIEYLYIFLVSIVGLLHYEGVVDIVGFQWFYLSIVNLSYILYIIIKNNRGLLATLKYSNNRNFQITFYFLYLFVSIVSVFFSLNQSIAIITISKIGIIFTTLIFLNQINTKDEKILNFIPPIFTLLLLIEISSSLYAFFEIIKVTDYKFSMGQEYLKGFAGNKNITSASIGFKIPFVYMFFKQSKNYLIKILLFAIIVFGFFNLFVLSSRALLLSYVLASIFLIATLIIVYFKKLKFLEIFKKFNLFFLPIIISFIIFNFNNSDQTLNITSRVSSINTSDVSASTRLRYYSRGLEYLSDNLFMGAGIGNFQLISIKLDSENIESYIVPYVAHNDFIEVFTELGIIGGLAYLFFVLTTGFYLIKLFFKLKDENLREKVIYLSIPFIIYLIDANLNFPQYRPIMQIAFIVYAVFVFRFYKKFFS